MKNAHILVFALVGFLAGLVNAAFAQPVLNSWHGPYAGVSLGYSAGDVGGLSVTGPAIGGFVGYNATLGPLLAGIEASAEGMNARASLSDGTASVSVKAGGMYAARARLGFVWNGMLFYGLGGVGMARLEANGDHTTASVFQAGAGSELKLSNTVKARVEAVQNFRNNAVGGLDFNATTLRAGLLINLN